MSKTNEQKSGIITLGTWTIELKVRHQFPPSPIKIENAPTYDYLASALKSIFKNPDSPESMKTPILFLLALFSILSVTAQQTQWVRTFQQQNPANPAYNTQEMAPLSDGSVWMAHMSNRRSSYSQKLLGDFKLYRISSTGALLDTVDIWGNAVVEQMASWQDETVVLLGYLDSIRVAGQTSNLGLAYGQAVLHIDGSGQERLLWFQPDTTNAITLNQQGEIVMAAGAFGAGTGVISRLDTAGNILQAKTASGIGRITNISQAVDGRYIITGSCLHSTFQMDSLSVVGAPFYNAYILSLSSTMTADWLRWQEDITCRIVHHAADHRGRTYMLSTTNTDSLTFDAFTMAGPSPSNTDFYLATLNSNAIFTGLQEIPGDTGFAAFEPGSSQPLAADAEGNIYMTGALRGWGVNWGGGYATIPPNTGNEVLVISWDTLGQIRWAKNLGGISFDYGNSLVVLGVDSLLVSGTIGDNSQFDSISVSGAPGTDFIALISATGTPQPILYSQSISICQGQSVTVGSSSYTTAGTYVDTLQASTNQDSIVTTTLSVDPLPLAAFTCDSSQIPTFSFSDQSTGNPGAWHWDFDDGDTSSLQNPTHTYAANGTYAVTLTVNNQCGSDSLVKPVSVQITGRETFEVLEEKNIQLFPNPATDFVKLRFPDSFTGEIQIFDAVGRRVSSYQVDHQIEVQLDLQNVQNGVYLLQVSGTGAKGAKELRFKLNLWRDW